MLHAAEYGLLAESRIYFSVSERGTLGALVLAIRRAQGLHQTRVGVLIRQEVSGGDDKKGYFSMGFLGDCERRDACDTEPGARA
jgi:hypothetical protein